MIRLGGKLNVDSQDLEEIARAHRAFGYTAAVCPAVSLADRDAPRRLREAFNKADVLLAEVGAWRSLLDPDPVRCKDNLAYVTEQLALAEEVGARCCVTFAGSVSEEGPLAPHPANLSQQGFELCVERVREVIDAVKPKRTKFCLEMMPWQLPDSPGAALALIRAVDRAAFAAHLDPVNIIVSPRDYFDNAALIQRCFRLLGPYIVSCHAKDIRLSPALTVHLDEVPPGQGLLDYEVYLRELAKLPGDQPLILEHLDSREAYAAAREHIRQVGSRSGIAIKQ